MAQLVVKTLFTIGAQKSINECRTGNVSRLSVFLSMKIFEVVALACSPAQLVIQRKVISHLELRSLRKSYSRTIDSLLGSGCYFCAQFVGVRFGGLSLRQFCITSY